MAFGSTAIFGSVDTAAILVRSERYRSIATVQRYGADLPESVLAWDPEERTASLGGTREEAEVERLVKEILEFLTAKGEPVTEALIDGEVEGRTGETGGGGVVLGYRRSVRLNTALPARPLHLKLDPSHLLKGVCPNSEFTGMFCPFTTWCPNPLYGPAK
jgi:hypothetical protein